LSARSTVNLASVFRRRTTKHLIFYQEAVGYWTKLSYGLPYYRRNGKVGAPPHGRYLYFDDGAKSLIATAILNSSLFYLFFVTFGDCYHLSDMLVSAFPIADLTFHDQRLQ